jgi:3'(2'), 5'-bisphosphate nucleotidase
MPEAGALLAALSALAHTAGIEVMRIYAEPVAAAVKADLSPVTEADLAAERIILEGLARLAPEIPVISEEAASQGRIPQAAHQFFLVDPLDGTREFISRNGEFTINIALIENGKPVAGVVYAPAIQRMFRGAVNTGAEQARLAADAPEISANWQPIRAVAVPAKALRVVASRSHRDAETDAFLAAHDVADLVAAGSSLKFCLIAAGEADLYPRFGRTMEWDTAAGHAVLAAAGGKVTLADGQTPLHYGKRERGYDNPAFIAAGA